MKTKKHTSEKITKEMTIYEIVQKYPKSQEVFIKHGMTCFGCPFALQETLEQGCKAHGIEIHKILKELNETVNRKNEKKQKN